MSTIDRNKILLPNVEITDSASQQVLLALINDPYLQGKSLRVNISGKGCDGFTYEVYFDQIKEDDFKILHTFKDQNITILLNPFSAYYLHHFKLDYILDIEQDMEGYHITNYDQEKYHGKFWKENSELTPPQKNNSH